MAGTAVHAFLLATPHGRHTKVPNALTEADLAHLIVRFEKFAESFLLVVHSEATAAADFQALSAILACLPNIRDFLSSAAGIQSNQIIFW